MKPLIPRTLCGLNLKAFLVLWFFITSIHFIYVMILQTHRKTNDVTNAKEQLKMNNYDKNLNKSVLTGVIDDASLKLKNARSRILVGVLTVPSKLPRRALIRSTYLRLKPSNVDFFFVFGKPTDESVLFLLRQEQKLYKDIMILPTPENMDEGKTYSFFTHVHSLYHNGDDNGGYKFVMKTDDDVFLHLANLEKRVLSLPTNGVFFGREVHGYSFMAGLGYLLSWDLVNFISNDPYAKEHTIGQEDATLAAWLRHGKVVKHWISEESEIYDDPSHLKGWSHEYTPGTLLIHRLKEIDPFLKASQHFLEGGSASEPS